MGTGTHCSSKLSTPLSFDPKVTSFSFRTRTRKSVRRPMLGIRSGPQSFARPPSDSCQWQASRSIVTVTFPDSRHVEVTFGCSNHQANLRCEHIRTIDMSPGQCYSTWRNVLYCTVDCSLHDFNLTPSQATTKAIVSSIPLGLHTQRSTCGFSMTATFIWSNICRDQANSANMRLKKYGHS